MLKLFCKSNQVKMFNLKTKEVKYFSYEDIDLMIQEIDKSAGERLAYNKKCNIINPHDLNRFDKIYDIKKLH